MLTLTVKDICAALGAPKHRVRAWTRFPLFRDRPTHARSAQRFDALDLLCMAVLQSLEQTYGIRPFFWENAVPAIIKFLSRPREPHNAALAYLNVSNWTMQPVTPDLALRSGLIIDVEQERERVAEFLGLRKLQGELPLRPMAVEQRRAGRTA